ncbi:glycosyl hydrolase family 62-domain-containing protein [Aspergillus leporis]|uniref:Alpha-L-arabinofuranosidase n=1 Tax=Aspergillus leporis TaxID=41062 RepID=A0A5N5WKA1_9EURO|nr:glycosyl hydrolase family 62-domain-containing protein [Aspergillus leporis]
MAKNILLDKSPVRPILLLSFLVRWSSSGPLTGPKNDGRNITGIKDPSIVEVNGKYHVFASTATKSGYSLVYLSFTDFGQANSATFYYLDQNQIGSGYRAAPQVFFFKPHNHWYLVYQNGNAAYLTNPDINNPAGWSSLADTETNPFARWNNVVFSNGNAWTKIISHGEMIRTQTDQTMSISPCSLRYMYQRMDPAAGGDYNLLLWRLGLLTQTNSAC